MKKLILTLIMLSFVYLTVADSAPAVIYVGKKPPKVKIEKPVGPKPSARSVWIAGHWVWKPAPKKYVWVKGHWATPPNGKNWVKGHWVKKPRGWIYIKGHWK